MPTIQKPNIGNWFKKEQPPEENSWFKETKKECCPSLSRFQRIVGFGLCICMGILCFTLSAMYIPVLLFKARKFALLFTLGSLFFVLSFSFLWGPVVYLKHMFSRERLFLTLIYGSTLLATLYFALHLQNTPFTVLFAVGQIVTLLWTVVSNIPGGATGVSFLQKYFHELLATVYRCSNAFNYINATTNKRIVCLLDGDYILSIGHPNLTVQYTIMPFLLSLVFVH